MKILESHKVWTFFLYSSEIPATFEIQQTYTVKKLPRKIFFQSSTKKFCESYYKTCQIFYKSLQKSLLNFFTNNIPTTPHQIFNFDQIINLSSFFSKLSNIFMQKSSKNSKFHVISWGLTRPSHKFPTAPKST